MTITNKSTDPQQLLGLLTSRPSAVPFKVNMTEQPIDLVASIIGPGAKIEHPCNAFARRAGYASWAAALIAMEAGKIVTASGPRIGRTAFEYDIFVKQIHADGLVMATPAHAEFGLVSVGLREHFPAKTLERVEISL